MRSLPIAFALVVVLAAPAYASTPSAVDDSYQIAAGHSAVVSVSDGLLANDIDGGSPSTNRVKLLTNPPEWVTVYDTGNFTYKAPDTAGTFTFIYCIAYKGDMFQCASTTTATVTLRVFKPVPKDDSYSTAYNTPLIVPSPGVRGNDVGVPSDASVGWSYPTGGPPSGFTLKEDGSFEYYPGRFTGTRTLRYCILAFTEPNCVTDFVTVTVVVGEPPVTVDDTYTTAPGAVLTVAAPGILANDTRAHAASKVSAQNQVPVGLELKDDGSFTYRPPDGFTGQVSFTYCLLERSIPPACASNTATVTITVAQPSPSPSPSPTTGGPTLPVTGSGALWPAIAGAVLLLAGAALTYGLRYRRHRTGR